MKILFARPRPPAETIGLQHIMVVEPLELEVLAAAIPSYHSVVIIDMILEKHPLEFFINQFKPDIFCVTGYITHMEVISDYCRCVKKIVPGTITIAGGIHIEKNHGDCDHTWVDFRVIRNATRTFPALIQMIEQKAPVKIPGVLVPGERATDLPPLDFYFPHPRRDLVKHYAHKYFYVFHSPVALLKTSFGCPSVCSFCYCREITDGMYHTRQLDDVFSELEKIPQNEIFIIDDNFLVHPSRVREFILGIQKRNIKKKFLVFGRAEFIAKYPAIIEQFRHAGLRTVIVGLESFSDSELEAMNKNISVHENEQALKTLSNLKIDCYAAIILHPDWSRNDFAELRKKIKAMKINFANYQPLTPLPGTGLTFPAGRFLVKRESYAEWDLAHLVIKPSKMSVSEYYQEIIRLYTLSVVHPLTILRHLSKPLPLVLRAAWGSFKVWRQYREKMKKADDDGI